MFYIMEMEMESQDKFNYRAHKQAIGLMYIAQLTLQLLIDDTENEDIDKQYAMEIHRWLGNTQCDIDNIFRGYHQYGMFLLQAMNIYEVNTNTSDCRVITDFNNARDLLEKQYEKYLQNEHILQKMALATITDTNYRGYD